MNEAALIILLLARVCSSEAGLNYRTNDCGAIVEVTRYRASISHRTFIEQLRAYSPEAAGGRPSSSRQRWITELNEAFEKPEHFPAHLNWDMYRNGWRHRLNEARFYYTHNVRVCQRTPHHWGMSTGPEYWARARIGWQPVNCGRVTNAFWTVP